MRGQWATARLAGRLSGPAGCQVSGPAGGRASGLAGEARALPAGWTLGGRLLGLAGVARGLAGWALGSRAAGPGGVARGLSAGWALALAGGLAVLGVLFTPGAALAATKTWTGGGGDDNWTTGANWGGTAPAAGDDLVFPAGAPRAATSFNNFTVGTSFNSITFNGSGAGYTIDGNRIALVAGITSSATGAHTDTLNTNLTLSANQAVGVTNGGVTLVLGGAIGGAGIDVTKSGPARCASRGPPTTRIAGRQSSARAR